MSLHILVFDNPQMSEGAMIINPVMQEIIVDEK